MRPNCESFYRKCPNSQTKAAMIKRQLPLSTRWFKLKLKSLERKRNREEIEAVSVGTQRLEKEL